MSLHAHSLDVRHTLDVCLDGRQTLDVRHALDVRHTLVFARKGRHTRSLHAKGVCTRHVCASHQGIFARKGRHTRVFARTLPLRAKIFVCKDVCV